MRASELSRTEWCIYDLLHDEAIAQNHACRREAVTAMRSIIFQGKVKSSHNGDARESDILWYTAVCMCEATRFMIFCIIRISASEYPNATLLSNEALASIPYCKLYLFWQRATSSANPCNSPTSNAILCRCDFFLARSSC